MKLRLRISDGEKVGTSINSGKECKMRVIIECKCMPYSLDIDSDQVIIEGLRFLEKHCAEKDV